LFVEPTLKVGGNLHKPDLVIKNEERVLVVDVTVKDYLSKAGKEKADKYQLCLAYLKEKFNVGGGQVLSVALSSRGAITPNTERILKEMGIANHDIKTIVMNILRSSIEICNIFLDE
jgi:5-methylcytosine-specific restriction endonuclease McrBC regulatory subunit McrC